jgi:hypothetical protein
LYVFFWIFFCFTCLQEIFLNRLFQVMSSVRRMRASLVWDHAVTGVLTARPALIYSGPTSYLPLNPTTILRERLARQLFPPRKLHLSMRCYSPFSPKSPLLHVCLQLCIYHLSVHQLLQLHLLHL